MTFDPTFHRGFASKNSSETTNKLKVFLNSGATGLHLVMDWDNTLTVRKANGIEGLTWAILRQHMTAANQIIHGQLYAKYHPKEKTGTMTDIEAMTWQTAALQLLIGLPIDAIQRDAVELVQLRDGVIELFDLCNQHHVPTVIKSAGVRQVIDAVATHNSLRPSLTHATKLLLADGKISGWDETTLTHAINKERFNHVTNPENAYAPHIILLGDDLQDARMVAGDTDVLRIRVGGGRALHNTSQEWEAFLESSYAAGYDMVSESDSFVDVVGLTRWLLNIS